METQIENADIWPSKLAYRITFLNGSVPFGGTISVRIELVPFKKGLRCHDLQMQLIDAVFTHAGVANHIYRDYWTETEIASRTFDLSSSLNTAICPGMDQEDTFQDEVLSFDAALCLPG